jgi:YegS/Rv2252/BmrU family lipid kinase
LNIAGDEGVPGMTQARKVAVVANPHAARGRVGTRWSKIRSALESRFPGLASRFTEESGHAMELTRDLLREGYDLVIAAGGDGTINEVANGFVNDDDEVFPDARLGILPLGTGGDFQRTLGIPSGLEAAIEVLAKGKTAAIDVGQARFAGRGGARESRYFVNVASFGMGGAVASRSKNLVSRVSGKLAFLWATFAVVAGYRGRRVELELDGAPLADKFRITNVAIGNGRFHGGGMQPCPSAVLNDGILEVTVIEYLNPFELARDIRILYSDHVYSHAKVRHFHARQVRARSEENVLLEVDGEPLGSLPLEVSLARGRLNVIVPSTSSLLIR